MSQDRRHAVLGAILGLGGLYAAKRLASHAARPLKSAQGVVKVERPKVDENAQKRLLEDAKRVIEDLKNKVDAILYDRPGVFVNQHSPMFNLTPAWRATQGTFFPNDAVSQLLSLSESLNQPSLIQDLKRLELEHQTYLNQQRLWEQEVSRGVPTYTLGGIHLHHLDNWTVEQLDRFAYRHSKNSVKVVEVSPSDTSARQLLLDPSACNVAIQIENSRGDLEYWIHDCVTPTGGERCVLTPQRIDAKKATGACRSINDVRFGHQIYFSRNLVKLLDAIKFINETSCTITVDLPCGGRRSRLTIRRQPLVDDIDVDFKSDFWTCLKDLNSISNPDDWPEATLTTATGIKRFRVGTRGTTRTIDEIFENALPDNDEKRYYFGHIQKEFETLDLQARELMKRARGAGIEFKSQPHGSRPRDSSDSLTPLHKK